MKRILFVDDERRVLQGLERLLFDYSEEWEMAFVTSGQDALDELVKSPFDVLVTDMRMPGMDGATLLHHVQQLYPNLVRIVLSGHTELETALRAMPIAHQFLCKPCDAETLMSVLQRACNLQGLVNDEAVRNLLGGIVGLPARPRVYSRLAAALCDEDCSAAKLASIVREDVAISSRLLHVVNSAFFSRGGRVSNIEAAVARLGTRMLRDLTLSIEVFGQSKRAVCGFSIDTISTHALMVGTLAQRLVSPVHKDDAFLGGMLHDVGLVVLMTCLPDYATEVLKSTRESRQPIYAVERSLKGVTHAEIGAYLLGLWGMPYPVVEAVANHHSVERNRKRGLDAATAVQVASALIAEVAPYDGEPHETPVDEGLLAELGVRGDLEKWRDLRRSILDG